MSISLCVYTLDYTDAIVGIILKLIKKGVNRRQNKHREDVLT